MKMDLQLCDFLHLVKLVNLNYSEDLGLKYLGQERFVVTGQ